MRDSRDLRESENIRVVELVRSVKIGNVNDFGEIYEIFVNRIYRFTYLRIGSKEDCEDITEIVFFKAYERIQDFNDQKGATFENWLYTIARHQIVDYFRTQKQSLPLDNYLEIESSYLTPHQIAEHENLISMVKLAIAKLPYSYKEIIILRFIEDKDVREISSLLNKPSDHVRVLQSRALKALKKLL